MKRKRIEVFAGMFFAGTLLLGACGQSAEGGSGGVETPADAARTVTLEPTEQAMTIPAETVKAGATQENTDLLTRTSASAMLTPQPDVELPLNETYFPDEAFREYLAAYVDRNGDGMLSQEERDAILGLGSVESRGGLADGTYAGKANLARGEMLRGIRSMEGIEYFRNLKEIYFEGSYALQKLPLDNPHLDSVWVSLSSVEEFSIKNAAELRSLCYRTRGSENIAWNELTKLEYLEVSDAELALEDLVQCKNLSYLTLNCCKLTGAEAPDFSGLSNLREFYCYVPEGQEGYLAKELHLENNEKLVKVTLSAKAAEKVILRDMNVKHAVEGTWEACTILFADELALDTAQALPEGSIWLTAENFPDEAFRQYLYQYVDENKDHILTEEERNAQVELGEVDYDGRMKLETKRKQAVLEQVRTFEGIQYLGNLQKLVLTAEYAVEKLHLDNPCLEEVQVIGTGIKEFSIKRAENLMLLFFTAKESVELDLSETQKLEQLSLTNASLDLRQVLQNQELCSLNLRNCSVVQPQEQVDFSGLTHLEQVSIILENTPEEYWAQSMCFGEAIGAAEWSGGVKLSSGVTGQVILKSNESYCKILDDAKECEIIYPEDME